MARQSGMRYKDVRCINGNVCICEHGYGMVTNDNAILDTSTRRQVENGGDLEKPCNVEL